MTIGSEVSCRTFFQDVYPAKLIVFMCTLLFMLLICLKEDGVIGWPYPVIFIPLWIWKLITIAGATVGFVVHERRYSHQNLVPDTQSETEFRSMLVSFVEMLLLFMFEILICIKLETQVNYLLWTVVFSPLILLSLMSIFICIWGVRRERNIEFELLFGVNVLQFVFIALRLDGMVGWSWVLLFVPLWILTCMGLIGVLYAVVLAVLLVKSFDLLPPHRRQHLFSAMGYTLLVIPLLIFLIMLTRKLDQNDHAAGLPYIMVCLPLFISLICLMFMACGTKGGNKWWFGMQTDFCQWLLAVCPLLQEYGNNSYRFDVQSEHSDHNSGSPTATIRFYPFDEQSGELFVDLKPVAQFQTIEMPD